MSILQILLISVFAGLCGIDLYNGQLHFHRPIITGPVVGLILGDLHTGLLAGASIEFVWMALVPLAGAQPPNVVIGGILGTAFTIITKQDPSIAVGIALPFAILGQIVTISYFSFSSIINPFVDKAIEENNYKKYDMIMYIWQGIYFLMNFVLVFIPLYFGAEQSSAVVSAMPEWLIAGLSAIGSIMPACGFAMLLKIMYKKAYLPFLVVGVIASAYLKLPVLAVAFIGCAVAGYDYFMNDKIDKIEESLEVNGNDGI
ncbi:MAG: PTS sugar transporter subunit IIC [Lachnospiraceae bacterium]